MTDGIGVRQDGEDVVVRVKAVPGAARDGIAGAVGDRLKVRVSAPPEGGRANRAICALLARRLGVKPSRVTIERGTTGPEKIVRITGITAAEVGERLARP